jgi:hypothetical protein
MTQQYYSWTYAQRNGSQDIIKTLTILMFITALFTIAKLQKQPICPTTDDELRKCNIYIQWNIIQ